jgi:uncharacterized NAD(P)/FAD-binding protein YdhS
MSKIIGVIGGGFSGTMTAIQLIRNADEPFSIFIVSEKQDLNRGIAYNSYSDHHILNVITKKMSAFPDQPDHFLEWVMAKDIYKNLDRTLLSNSFLSRNLYGDYLCDLWREALLEAEEKNIQIVEINDTVASLKNDEQRISLSFQRAQNVEVDFCVIATGNQIPKNPRINNSSFYQSSNYFQNPWTKDTVVNVKTELPILIVGNGLTMVDTIIGLKEQNFKGEIYSISPNGFNILPHRHTGMQYTAHLDEIYDGIPLDKLVRVLNKHIKIVRNFGVSAEPIIDALRPLSHKIWRGLSKDEKAKFMSRLRHLFGVARHRIPLHIYDKIQKLRIDGKLYIQSGNLISIVEDNGVIEVTYYDKKLHASKTIQVSRVINCTGPETDLSKMENNFISQCIQEGLFSQDELKLGLKTNVENFKLISKEGKELQSIYTLGSNLKGELWETTAVNELRQQADAVAKVIIYDLNHKQIQSEKNC